MTGHMYAYNMGLDGFSCKNENFSIFFFFKKLIFAIQKFWFGIFFFVLRHSMNRMKIEHWYNHFNQMESTCGIFDISDKSKVLIPV